MANRDILQKFGSTVDQHLSELDLAHNVSGGYFAHHKGPAAVAQDMEVGAEA